MKSNYFLEREKEQKTKLKRKYWQHLYTFVVLCFIYSNGKHDFFCEIQEGNELFVCLNFIFKKFNFFFSNHKKKFF